MLVDLILKTIEPALNPFAGTVIGSFGIVTLAGYFVLGYLFSNTLWQALRNGFLLGVVIFILAVAAGDLFSIQLGELAMWFGLHQLAAVFLTASANVSRKWYDFT